MNKEKEQKRVQPKKTEEGLSYSVEVRDKEGRVIQRISAPSHCFTEQWNQIVNIHAKYTNSMVRQTNGVEISTSESGYCLRVSAAIGVTNNGLRVGKGFTPVAIDDYALETPLEEGAGVDQFNHQVVTFTAPAVVGTTCSFTVKRIFVNNSGATITGIREIGAYVQMGATGVNYALGFRDVLPGAVIVPDGGSITVTYTIPVTV